MLDGALPTDYWGFRDALSQRQRLGAQSISFFWDPWVGDENQMDANWVISGVIVLRSDVSGEAGVRSSEIRV